MIFTRLFFIFNLLSLAGVLAFAGGATSGGGGGSLESKNGILVLSDYTFFQNEFIRITGRSLYAKIPNVRSVTFKSVALGLQRHDFSKSVKDSDVRRIGPVELLKVFLQAWAIKGKTLTPIEIPILMQGQNLNWSISCEPGHYAAYFSFCRHQAGPLRGGSCLSTKDEANLRRQGQTHFQVESRITLYATIWNQADLWSQAGLILHEMLRYKQLSYGSYNFSDATLKEATALFMLCAPDAAGAEAIAIFIESLFLYPNRNLQTLRQKAYGACEPLPFFAETGNLKFELN